jgi:putative transposase
MQRRQAFKYELMPNGEQRRQMRRFAGSCRYVFNEALGFQKTRFAQGEKSLALPAYASSSPSGATGRKRPG